MEQPIISIENVSKVYRLGAINSGTLIGDYMSWRARRRGEPDPNIKIGKEWWLKSPSFPALDGLSLSVTPGERVGIIGANGAGKSTLLKMISRITVPTDGVIRLNGRVASMLEVGTGFSPELTGRENIFLNGALLGMQKETISRKLESIIEFSECEKFIDTPVKRYSSGMKIRLGFAVAAHLDNEIMLMDEVLAVGDAIFQQKCIDKMNEISADSNRTILYVSHMMRTVRELCSRCVVLERGRLIFDGDVDEGISVYMKTNGASSLSHDLREAPRLMIKRGRVRYVDITSLRFLGRESVVFEKGETVRVRIEWECREPVRDACFQLAVYYSNGEIVGTVTGEIDCGGNAGRYVSRLDFSLGELEAGSYYFRTAMVRDEIRSLTVLDYPNVNVQFEVSDEKAERRWEHRNWGHIVLGRAEVSTKEC